MSAATEWPLRRLGEICEFKYGKSLPESARSGGEVPVYGSNGVVGGHDVPLTASETIVIGRKGSHGEVNFSDKPCWPIDTTYFVDSTATKANLNWLKYRLAGAGLNQMNRAAAVPGLNREDAYRVEILLPPLEEQRRIAAILDQAETLRTQRRAALAQLDSLTQSLFLDMFGDPVANPKQWDVVPFGTNIATSLRNGLSPSSDGIMTAKVLTLSAITGGGFNADAWKLGAFHAAPPVQQSVNVNDFLVCRGNGNVRLVGKGYFPDQSFSDVTFPDTIIAARINVQLIAREYLQFIWNSSAVRRQVEALARTTNGTFKVNQTMLESIQIVMPPLALQQTFATRIQAIEALKATHRAALAELDALFASLQQRAFSGELTARASSNVAVPLAKRSFADLGQLNASKGVESLVYAAKRLPGKGHYWPTKAQYFADKRHLERYGRSIYGETYVAMGRGPVPQAAYNASRALAEGELICEFPLDVVRAALRRDGNALIAMREADADALSAQERECLDWAIRYVKDLSFDELQTASHDAAWKKTAANGPMAWEDIVRTLEPGAQKRLLLEFA